MKRLCLEHLCFVNLNCYLNSNLILRKFKFVKRLCLEWLCFFNLNCYKYVSLSDKDLNLNCYYLNCYEIT